MESVEENAGRQGAAIARNRIEDVLLRVPDLEGRVNRVDVRDRLLRAIACAYAVLDSGPLARSHLDGLTEAAKVVEEVRLLLGRSDDRTLVPDLVGHLAMASSALVAARETIVRFQLAHRAELHGSVEDRGPPPPRPFRASIGVPGLFAIARASLMPTIEIPPRDVFVPAPPPPPPPVPATLTELAAFAEAAQKGAFVPPAEPTAIPPLPPPDAPPLVTPKVEETEATRVMARAYLERLAGGRTQRKPNEIETWSDMARFEQRTLDVLDAFYALGSEPPGLVSLFLAEAGNEDPDRAFAAALVYGCLDGHDAAGALLMAIKQSAPETYPGWREGLALASSRAVDQAMVDLATSGRIEWAELGLDVLDARAGAPLDSLAAIATHRKEPSLLVRAARGARRASDRNRAIEILEPLLHAERPEVAAAAATSLLVHRATTTEATLRRWLSDPGAALPLRDAAARLLCFGGGSSDAMALAAHFTARPSIPLARALGRFGHVEVLAPLVEAMRGEDEELDDACAEALARITGGGPHVEIDVPWDTGLEAAATPNFAPEIIPTRKVRKPSPDAPAWRTFLRDIDLPAHQKIRGGRPFDVMDVLVELESAATPPERRPEAALELAIARGPKLWVDTSTWVMRQKGRLAEVRLALSPAAPAIAEPEPEAPVRSHMVGTMVGALDLGSMLPFLHGAAAASAPPSAREPAPRTEEPRSSAAKLGETSMDLAPPSIALPFAGRPEASRPAPAVAPFAAPSPVPPPAPPSLVAGPATPPPIAITAAPPIVIAAAPAVPLGTMMSDGKPTTPALPFARTPAITPLPLSSSRNAPSGPPLMPLDRYAALCAAIGKNPRAADETCRAFGFPDRAAFRGVDDDWQARLAADASLKAIWLRLVEKYRSGG